MLKSNLIEDLSAFHEEDRRRLRRYLLSHCSTDSRGDRDEIRLLHYLLEALTVPEETEREHLLQRERIYAALFGSLPFDKERFARVHYAALARLREFIRFATSVGDNGPDGSGLPQTVAFFLDRGAPKVAARYVKSLERQLREESKAHVGREQERRVLAAKRVLSHFYITIGDAQGAKYIQEALSATETLYLSEQADLLLALLNLHCQRELPAEIDVKAQVTAFLERSLLYPAWANGLIGRLYTSAIRTMWGSSAEQEEAFEVFYALYASNQERLERYERDRFEALIFNFCARHFGQVKYREYLLQLYRQQASQMSSSSRRTIHANAFLSLVRLGLYAGDVAFVRALTEDCRKSIYGQDPSEMYYQLGRAYMAFDRRDFTEAYNILQRINFSAPEHRYLVRLLEIRILYEQQEDDLLESRLHALRMALKRDTQLALEKKQSIRHFYQLMLQLCRLREEFRAGKRLSTSSFQRLMQQGGRIDTQWFRAKLQEMEQRRDRLSTGG